MSTSNNWYPGLIIKAKSKDTGRIFTVREAHIQKVAGREIKCYTLEEDGTDKIFVMPEDKLELIKTDARNKS